MKLLGSLLFILIPSGSWAQQVVSVFDDQSMKTRITLPFYFKPQAGEQLINVRIQNISGSPSCLAQKDYFKTDNFLLRCENAGTIQVLADYKGAAGDASISYGPLVISELRPGYVEPTKVPTPTPTPDPRGAQGRSLIQNSCKGCHSSATIAVGKTADLRNESFASLKAAVTAGVRTMPSINPRPSDAELQAIEVYLKNIDGFGGWP